MAATGPPRERIMREATRVLARGGQPSVAEIARAAGVSRTTFYRAFASRAGLLQALELEPEPGARQRVLDVARIRAGVSGHRAARLRQAGTVPGRADDRRPAPADASDARRAEPRGRGHAPRAAWAAAESSDGGRADG